MTDTEEPSATVRAIRAIKAEALREAAEDWYGDDGPWDDHGSEATWLRERADRIEGITR
jgi:hypothetical protein